MEQVELEEVETVCHDRVGSLSSFLKLFDDDIVASDALEACLDRLVTVYDFSSIAVTALSAVSNAFESVLGFCNTSFTGHGRESHNKW